MDRPFRLALPVALLAAIVVPLRSIVVFESVRRAVDPVALSLLSRGLWSAIAVVGFPAVGYAYGEATAADRRSETLVVAGAAAAVGTLVGMLALRFGTGASMPGSVVAEVGTVGVFVVLDAAMFGLLVLAGHALAGPGDRR